MPVTTYLSHEPKHENKEILELLEELSIKTKTSWCAEKILRRKHFFKEDQYVTYLYKKLLPGGNEYQQFTCVTNDRELISYLYGALATPNFSEYRYLSMQHTVCSVCGEDKHTPLRRDEMGGYVCLTCIDKKLDEHLSIYSLCKEIITWHDKTIGSLYHIIERLRAKMTIFLS